MPSILAKGHNPTRFSDDGAGKLDDYVHNIIARTRTNLGIEEGALSPPQIKSLDVANPDTVFTPELTEQQSTQSITWLDSEASLGGDSIGHSLAKPDGGYVPIPKNLGAPQDDGFVGLDVESILANSRASRAVALSDFENEMLALEAENSLITESKHLPHTESMEQFMKDLDDNDQPMSFLNKYDFQNSFSAPTSPEARKLRGDEPSSSGHNFHKLHTTNMDWIE